MAHPDDLLDPRLDPELAAALAAMPRAANGSLMDLTDIPALRRQLRAAIDSRPPEELDASAIRVQQLDVPRHDGSSLTVILLRPVDRDDTLPALLWFHAGGQVVGSAEDDIAYCAGLALSLDCAVAAVDYRLAPDTPAPGAAQDGYLAYVYLHANAAPLGLDPIRLGIAGASGGGAIAAATALMLRDQEAAPPRVLSLLYPMLDDRNDTRSSHEVTDIGVWDRRENLLAWAAVLGDRVGTADVDHYCAPGRAENLADLPTAFVAAAQFDVFRDEDVDFARRLMAAGTTTELHVYAGAFHAWDRFAPESELTHSLERAWHSFLRRKLVRIG